MEKRDKVIFISGKYSGDVDKHINFARDFAEELWDEGYTVFCPHLNTANFDENSKTSWQDYLNGDLEILRRCDAVFALPNWKDSNGSRIEIADAFLAGIPVFESIAMLNLWFEQEALDEN